MVYSQVEMKDLKKKHLEITVWSYKDRTFLGQVIIHLSGKLTNTKANQAKLIAFVLCFNLI